MLGIYLDHHVRRAVAEGLRARGVDVLTAYDDQHHTVPDSDLLDRATALGACLADLEVLAKTATLDDVANQCSFCPCDPLNSPTGEQPWMRRQ